MSWHCRNLSHMLAKNRVQFFSSSLSKPRDWIGYINIFTWFSIGWVKKHCWSWEVRLITTVGWKSKRCSGFQHGSHNIACDRSLRFNLLKKKKKTLSSWKQFLGNFTQNLFQPIEEGATMIESLLLIKQVYFIAWSKLQIIIVTLDWVKNIPRTFLFW